MAVSYTHLDVYKRQEYDKISVLTDILQIIITDTIREKMAGDYSPSVENYESETDDDFGYILSLIHI